MVVRTQLLESGRANFDREKWAASSGLELTLGRCVRIADLRHRSLELLGRHSEFLRPVTDLMGVDAATVLGTFLGTVVRHDRRLRVEADVNLGYGGGGASPFEASGLGGRDGMDD